MLAAAWVVVMMTTGWLGGSLYVLNRLRLTRETGSGSSWDTEAGRYDQMVFPTSL